MGLFRDKEAEERIELLTKVIEYQEKRIEELERYLSEELGIESIDAGRSGTFECMMNYVWSNGRRVSSINPSSTAGLDPFMAKITQAANEALYNAEKTAKEKLIERESDYRWHFKELGSSDRELKTREDSEFEEEYKELGLKSIVRIGEFGYRTTDSIINKNIIKNNEAIKMAYELTAVAQFQHLICSAVLFVLFQSNSKQIKKLFETTCNSFGIDKNCAHILLDNILRRNNYINSLAIPYEDEIDDLSEQDTDEAIAQVTDIYETYAIFLKHLRNDCYRASGACRLNEDKECNKARKMFLSKKKYSEAYSSQDYIFEVFLDRVDGLREEDYY